MVSESSHLYITCSTLNSKKPSSARGFMHLCKDGSVVRKKQQRSSENDVVFIVGARLCDAGNYSCVYSVDDLPLSAAAEGLNAISIRVIGTDPPSPAEEGEGGGGGVRPRPAQVVPLLLQPMFTPPTSRRLGRRPSGWGASSSSRALSPTSCRRWRAARSSGPT